jgi:hypothetical protein
MKRDGIASDNGRKRAAAMLRDKLVANEAEKPESNHTALLARMLERGNPIQNGFGLSTRVLPLRVAYRTMPDDAAPSVQFHYRTFDPTTSDSAPVPRIGTLTLAEAFRLDFSLCIGATGSHVPHQSLIQGHAAFMPEASWAVSRFPSQPDPGVVLCTGFGLV